MAVLIVPLLALHFGLHVVHRILGFVCDSLTTELIAADGDRAAQRYVYEQEETCCHKFMWCIGFLFGVASFVVWIVAQFALYFVDLINDAFFGIEWLEQYAENYDSATLPSCDRLVEVHSY